MSVITNVLIGVVAALHIYFLILEMFLWQKPTGRRIFGLTKEFAKESANLAKNQGLYNGFLAAGLVWGMSLGSDGESIIVFFLGCVAVAGIFGAMTVNRRILFVQAVPALAALALVLFA